MIKKKPFSIGPAQLLLGEKLEQLRISKDVTRKQLGRIVNVPEQQIARFEAGEFVPIAMLERITKTLGEPIQKKWIRRISALRHRETVTKQEQPELYDLYQEIFADIDDA